MSIKSSRKPNNEASRFKFSSGIMTIGKLLDTFTAFGACENDNISKMFVCFSGDKEIDNKKEFVVERKNGAWSIMQKDITAIDKASFFAFIKKQINIFLIAIGCL